MKELIFDMAGGMRPGQVKAVIPGGSSVPIMTAAETEDCLMDYEGIVARGSMLGSAGFIVMMLHRYGYQVYRLARFYAHESCAQCTQCREVRRGRSKSWNACWRQRQERRPEASARPLRPDDGKNDLRVSDSCAAPVVSGIHKFPGGVEAYVSGSRKRCWRRYETDGAAFRAQRKCGMFSPSVIPSEARDLSPGRVRGRWYE